MTTRQILILFSILFVSKIALAGDIIVIANASVTVAQSEVKDIFLGEKQTAGGAKIIPVDNKSIQAEFVQKALGMDVAKYNSLWAKKSFQDGIVTPKTKGSDADVIEFVKSTSGAIGYVSTAPADVKVVGKF